MRWPNANVSCVSLSALPGAESEFQSIGAVSGPDHLGHAGIRSELTLEPLHLGAQDEAAMRHHPLEALVHLRRDLGVLQGEVD